MIRQPIRDTTLGSIGTPSELPTRLASDRLPSTKTDANGRGRPSCPAKDKADYGTAGLVPISRLRDWNRAHRGSRPANGRPVRSSSFLYGDFTGPILCSARKRCVFNSLARLSVPIRWTMVRRSIMSTYVEDYWNGCRVGPPENCGS